MMTLLSTREKRASSGSRPPAHDRPAGSRRRGVPIAAILPTTVLIVSAVYFLLPVVWVFFSATKSSAELFTTPAFSFGTALWDNLVALFAYENGGFAKWLGNSFFYSIVGALASTLFSAGAGYALAMYDFRGKHAIMVGLLGGVLLPTITLAIPQYLLFAQIGLANTYWSVLIPTMITPFGIYLAYVFARASMPVELLEAARVDGSSEWRTFRSIGLPMLLPGLVTIFLLQFIGAWNNFLLPYIMLTDPDLFPITVSMYMMLNRGGSEPILYTLAIAGAAVAIIPVVAFVLVLQRYWRLDLVSGSLK
ncbi:carbohydrate ABC transporter permease [Microbacterium sp. NPDC056234]|jgi:multiple sugar transport system permease protein|uniref:carbohydrate ABC transporter permease n=1 Tax=Microbacterium sp. NPDC056234 TaxID=3345757 RepID=UPI0035DD6864